MIYNLSKYISDNTEVVPVTNGFTTDSAETGVSLNQTGGSDKSRGLFVNHSAQVISRSKSQTESYRLVQIVYNLLENIFNVALPEVTVDKITYPEVTVGAILPLQMPGYIGTDNNGLHMWSVNFQVTIRR